MTGAVDYPSPWYTDELSGVVYAANGKVVVCCVAFDERIGVDPIVVTHAKMVVDAANSIEAINIADNISHLQRITREWADDTFPQRMPANAWMKLFEELGEVIRSPLEPDEWADVFILLFDLASIYAVTDIGAAVRAKLELNRRRKWRATETGTMQSQGETG